MNIKKVKYLGGYKLELTFSNNKVKVVDMEVFVFDSAFSGFYEYQDKNKFKKARLHYGGLAWGDNHVDLTGDYLYNWEKNENIERKRRNEPIIEIVEFCY